MVKKIVAKPGGDEPGMINTSTMKPVPTQSTKKKSFFDMLREEFKDDPEAMKMLIPVPDYGAVNSILLMKVLDELRKNDSKK